MKLLNVFKKIIVLMRVKSKFHRIALINVDQPICEPDCDNIRVIL